MTNESITLVTAIVGAACGVTGAVLGVLNTWHQMQRNKIRLKVIPKHVIPVGAIENAPINFGIEVVNLSDFPVVIDDVGFLLKGNRHATLISIPGLENSGKLPCRLEPRTSYSKCFYLDQNTLDFSITKCAYARTQCGSAVTGTSPALNQLLKQGAL